MAPKAVYFRIYLTLLLSSLIFPTPLMPHPRQNAMQPPNCNPKCFSFAGTKVNLFSDSSRKQGLVGKISECLPVSVDENDSLPKTICELCIQQVQQISEYRQKCVNTQTMLEGCLGTNKLKTEGRVSSDFESVRFFIIYPLNHSLSQSLTNPLSP